MDTIILYDIRGAASVWPHGTRSRSGYFASLDKAREAWFKDNQTEPFPFDEQNSQPQGFALDDPKTSILSQLAEIDKLSIRPLRAAASGAASEEDIARLASLESKAGSLRAELARQI